MATLDWSYDLLERDQRLLLNRLGVFAGTFDVALAEIVCTDDHVDALDVDDRRAGAAMSADDIVGYALDELNSAQTAAATHR